MTDRDEQSERTYEPTTLQLERARRRGQVAYSGELAAAIVLAGSLAAVAMIGPALLSAAVDLVSAGLEGHVQTALAGLLWPVAGLLVTLFVLAALAGLVQLGLGAGSERPLLDWSRISPASNLRRLFSARSAVRGLLLAVKLIVIAAIAYVTFRGQWDAIVAAGLGDLADMLATGRAVLIQLAVRCGLALLAIGIVDYLFQRWQLRRDLRMTRQQVRDDMKQTDANPAGKSRRRQAQAGLVKNRETPSQSRQEVTHA